MGYYKEPEKSAETFVEIDGQRYVQTGDRCRVREDGKLVLLGRDSTVINTGGEKVYTVEVERVLVDHPSISDALVVGLTKSVAVFCAMEGDLNRMSPMGRMGTVEEVAAMALFLASD